MPDSARLKEHEHIPGAAVLVIAAAPLRGGQLKGLTQRDRRVIDLIKVLSRILGAEGLCLELRVLEGVLFLDRDPDDVGLQVMFLGYLCEVFLNDGDPVAAGLSIRGDQHDQPRGLEVAVKLLTEGLSRWVDELYARWVKRCGREAARHHRYSGRQQKGASS